MDLDAKTILIVEDEASYRELLEFNLSAAGYRVEQARDGVEAMEKIGKSPPDLVLLDGLLPRLHGFEACRKIKQSPVTNRIPVIIMTAVYKKLQYKYQATGEYGADDFITKPFEISELLNRIKRLIG
jgi:DNA-binding response OmpR family regulator